MYASYPLATSPPAERLDYFQAIVDRVFCPMQVLPNTTSSAPLAGCVEAAPLRSIGLARVATSACLVRRRPQDIARMSDAPYLVKFQLRGEAIWSQRDSVVRLRPGDFVLCSTAEPYSLRFRDSFEMPVLSLAASTLRRLTPDPDQFLGVRMSGEDADCGLLSSFVAQVVARMNRLSDPIIRRVEANILDLLGGVLSARDRRATLSAAECLAQIKGYVAEHLHDRRLGPAMIASAMGVSTRYVHSLFENEPMTVGRYIRSQRVASCRRVLEVTGTGSTSLTDVALAWGFYDLSHMCRCFREEYGASPGEFRARPDRA